MALLAHLGDLYADELRPAHLDSWFAHLRGPHLDSRGRLRGPIQAGGFNAYLSRVRPFLTWMYLNDLIERDYGKTLRRMRRPHRMRLQLDQAQVRALHSQGRHRLVQEARARLVDLGVADEAMLAGEPAIVVSDGGDSASAWAHVTFSWTRADRRD